MKTTEEYYINYITNVQHFTDDHCRLAKPLLQKSGYLIKHSKSLHAVSLINTLYEDISLISLFFLKTTEK